MTGRTVPECLLAEVFTGAGFFFSLQPMAPWTTSLGLKFSWILSFNTISVLKILKPYNGGSLVYTGTLQREISLYYIRIVRLISGGKMLIPRRLHLSTKKRVICTVAQEFVNIAVPSIMSHYSLNSQQSGQDTLLYLQKTF